ncbi:hypothetical protein JI664_21595 [Rhodobacter sp. NTK016B]|uniref:hypothetical protein n=1 Tax=Rhodobacter sp. NTK016B TaxID=2759676 RepID=UPI001A90687B|nr:hypothetical protein [Rhodobacter sp. NTK016B]MBN8294582.1 hypothetical protein [Rhodobacter sp. NTK016B]
MPELSDDAKALLLHFKPPFPLQQGHSGPFLWFDERSWSALRELHAVGLIEAAPAEPARVVDWSLTETGTARHADLSAKKTVLPVFCMPGPRGLKILDVRRGIE